MTIIAIASGKGGTGKTMVATSLAASLSQNYAVQLLDCDVEGPNAHLFLHPEYDESTPATIALPVIDPAICTLCGRCVEVCAFHALAKLGTQILVFPQLCHGCGSCTVQCPVQAITESPKAIGVIRQGKTPEGICYGMGELTISEPMPTPIIRQLKAKIDFDVDQVILDSPPGASCSVVATVHDADYAVLVTEPTPFGLHDLRQMLGVLAETQTPAGVIINRDGLGDTEVETYLAEKGVPVLMRIPYQPEIAVGLAGGQLLIDILPGYAEKFRALHLEIVEILKQRSTDL